MLIVNLTDCQQGNNLSNLFSKTISDSGPVFIFCFSRYKVVLVSGKLCVSGSFTVLFIKLPVWYRVKRIATLFRKLAFRPA